MPEDGVTGFRFNTFDEKDARDIADVHIDEIAVITRFDESGKQVEMAGPESREPTMDWHDDVPPDMTDGFDFML